MEAPAGPNPALWVGLAFAGAFVAVSLWLWSQHGASVYLTRLADFAMTCF